jgi:xanthine dehydrogenase accessory factor
MREFLSDLGSLQETGDPVAVATLVRVQGSAPRLPGARLCCSSGGAMHGSVSAGCVENDVFENAQQVLQSGEPKLVNYGIAKEEAFQVGLSCGGNIDVLIEPFREDALWNELKEAVAARRPVLMATGITQGSLLGKKMLLSAEAVLQGEFAQECATELLAAARELLQAGSSAQVRCFTVAGDEIEVFLEPVLPPRRLYIVGGNHIAIPLSQLAKRLGYFVGIVDPRSVFASSERFPDADELYCVWPEEFFKETRLDAFSCLVTLSHDMKFDVPALAHALTSDAGYIGALGSRKTHAKRCEELRSQGFSDEDLAKIHSPIGLDLGGRRPEEIALAILSEMQTVRYGRSAGNLRERQAPISHDG